MTDDKNTLAIMLFGELLAADQQVRSRLTRVLPRGMEISHFSVLNSLSWHGGERSPAQLAETFNVTRGAMTNTLSKLEWAGYIHIRPDQPCRAAGTGRGGERDHADDFQRGG